MNRSLSVFAFAMIILLPLSAQAQQGKRIPIDMTITLQGYELPKKDAAAILLTLDAKLDATSLIQQVTKARAKIIKLGSIKATSSERAIIEEKLFRWELEPVLGADGRTMDVNLAFEQNSRVSENRLKIVTSITVTDGCIVFLGTVEEPRKDTVELVFMRGTLSRAAP